MGLIVDSNVIISSERRGESPSTLLSRIKDVAGDQEVALSAIGFTELVHGIYRTDSPARRLDRRALLNEYSSQLRVYPYTQAVAELAGKIDGEQTARKVIIPYVDLLIGATALSLNFSILTSNVRHFRLIPALNVIPF